MFQRSAQHPPLPGLLLGLIGLLFLISAPGCSAGGPEEYGGPDYAALVITSDMAVGRSRVAFGVADRDGFPVRAREATVRVYYLPSDGENKEFKSTVEAKFLDWPTTAQGVFEADLDFDAAGYWQIEADLTGPDGQEITAESAFNVNEVSSTPAIGRLGPGQHHGEGLRRRRPFPHQQRRRP